MVVQTNHQSTKYAVENKWYSHLFTNGENLNGKNPPGDFKVTTSEIPLLSQQAITSKGISVSYTNLQLNLYPNTQLDLFSSDNLSFQCAAPNTWLTNSMSRSQYSQTWERCWLQSSSVHHTMKITKLLSYKPMGYKYSSFFKRKMN